MDFQDFLKSRVATWVLILGIILVLVGFGRVSLQKYKIDKEIGKLQEQANKIQKDNEQLSHLIKYFNTEDYQEKQAREKFNLKKEGEFVVGLPEGSTQDEDNILAESQLSNAKKWFSYFFATE